MNLISKTSALSSALLLSSALFVLPTGSAGAQQSSRPVLSAAQCQPLTEGNFEMCCVAQNRSEFLTPGEIEACPPITTALVESVMEAMEGEADDERRGGQRNAADASNPPAANPDRVDNTKTGSVGGSKGNAPGQSGSPGKSADAPGQSKSGGPGNSENAPGRSEAPAAGKSQSERNDGFGNGGNDGQASGKHGDSVR